MQGLPAGWNCDPDRAALERQAIFHRTWQFVCHVADLPATGTAARFDCAGRSAFVLRTRAGGLAAFLNACRHRGARLVDGDAHTGLAYCVDGRVRCPYHGWHYDETGALVSIPETPDFRDLDRGAHGLHGLHVAEWQGLVFVAFEAPPQPLTRMLALVSWPGLASLRRLHEPRTHAVAADWKLACQHLVDATHRDIARPAVQPRVFASPRFAPAGADALVASAMLADSGNTAWSARTYQMLLPGEATTPRADFVFLWPNLLLCAAPDGVAVTQVLPESAGRSLLRQVRYGLPDGSRAMRLLRYAHERVQREALRDDLRMLERAQGGAESLGADATGPIGADECATQWFVRRYVAACKPPSRRRIKSNARQRTVAESPEAAAT